MCSVTTLNKHFAQQSKTLSKIFEIYKDSEKKKDLCWLYFV